MIKYILFLLVGTMKCYSQTTYISNLTIHVSGIKEKMRREFTISNDTIEIKSFGRIATHSQIWEVIEVEKSISDKSYVEIYKCVSLDREFPTIIMVLYEGDNTNPSQIVAIQPTPVNMPDEKTIFWIE